MRTAVMWWVKADGTESARRFKDVAEAKALFRQSIPAFGEQVGYWPEGRAHPRVKIGKPNQATLQPQQPAPVPPAPQPEIKQRFTKKG